MQSVTSGAVKTYVDTSLTSYQPKLSVTSGTDTATDESLTWVKYGNLVQVFGRYAGTISAGGNRTMTLVLDQGYIPKTTYRATLIDNDHDEPCGQCVLETNGVIRMWVSTRELTSKTNLQFSATYIV